MNPLVLVTGASRGIGLGIAQAFAAAGYRVALNSRTDAAALQHAVESLPTTAHGFLYDISDYAQAQALYEDVHTRMGPLTALVNNAGASHFGLFTDMSPENIYATLAHNLHTTLHMCHLAIPAMVRARAGCIINISSVQATTGASCEAVYAAAKGAVNALTKSLAQELGPSNVRVNAIACGAFDTRMNHRLDPQEKAALLQNIPLERLGQPHEAGSLAVYLASPAATYLTGQVIGLDGGWG